MAEERQYGVVQRWTEKGFGFISRPDFGDSLFCHNSETPNRAALVPGSKVSFVYESDEKGGKAKQVLIEEAVVENDSAREMGTVKRWNAEKGFGFIGRANGGDDAFVHKKECGGKDLVEGQAVSFVFEEGPKGASAKNVREEEGGTVTEEVREMGTIKRWNAEKGFGFIGRANGGDDAFVHLKECGGKDFVVGQAVSFAFEEGPKGASAKNVREEEGSMMMEEAVEEDEGERELGKVKSYNEEKGFAFIGRCSGGDDVFGHKREFGSVEPYVGQPVSFILENTEKGDTAKKIRKEDSVPEPILSDEGREFGTVKNFNMEKGFGFIVRKKGGDDAHIHEKQCNGLTLEKDMCVSFVCEDSGKGPAAKDLRQEDPARVARVTAKVHYGKVERYLDPPDTKPDSGYGFITPLNTTSYGAPKKYYFHMSEIETPDEYGGIEPGTSVSFTIATARSGKGVQAVAVTIADPPKEDKENENPIHASLGALKVTEADDTGDAADGDTWGTGGSDAWA
ncbi:hypothetical protein HO173_010047 [Letharia columbiana]|uniref:CSD domain-containing protein n=1 Tax=Letharia columbiana TaxID=112416 RepID=A0A8H6FNE7_9LECA|nr:uncharacterized protein HO173_010047 [Letharia columbiana]KAF6231745.1 hypothetical protein HO173_010047 [Letharia columbiana]